jgi:acyl carrier protein
VSSILIDLVASVIDVPASELNAQSGPGAVPAWDSLAHVTIVAAVEQTYGVKLSMPEILAIRSIDGLRQLLEKHGVKDLSAARA